MASFARGGPQQLIFVHRLMSREYWHKLQWFSIHDHGTKHSVKLVVSSFSCFFRFSCFFNSSAFSLSVLSNCRFSNGFLDSSIYLASTRFPKIKSRFQTSQRSEEHTSELQSRGLISYA